ncbi:Os12g0267100 [Oryza sativa Japonica Group]|uniref:Os12g0267100 protein n=1 Tax=Oryza sativa subsp. japonica TaxID=39947 RepID=Q0IP10_ORYSJ|nr:Os12g0267100 [Oryza sativa Japonica Group]|eukprot:NP_001066536.1 Os12g0267100 [Oryza sativa Japonica Group]
MRVAVVGAGVSGLAAAHELATSCAGGVDVTVYEKEDSLGGSFARTVGVDGGAGGEVVHLHLGFMPFNSVMGVTGAVATRWETNGHVACLILSSFRQWRRRWDDGFTSAGLRGNGSIGVGLRDSGYTDSYSFDADPSPSHYTATPKKSQLSVGNKNFRCHSDC